MAVQVAGPEMGTWTLMPGMIVVGTDVNQA